MIELARSAVQTWECDQMGHMNVQFYMEKAAEALAALGVKIGLGPKALARKGLMLEPVDQHVRFLRELRVGAPFFVRGGVVEAGVLSLTAYFEMVQTVSGEVSATFRTVAHLRNPKDGGLDGFDDGVRAMATHLQVEIPAHGSPRGLTLAAPCDPAPTWADAEALKLFQTFQGTVKPSDCDRRGEMQSRFYMARISDAIPNLMVQSLASTIGKRGKVGGAALEHRLIYRRTAFAGDVLCVRSGLRTLTPKTYTWAHWLFDVETGEALATSEAIAVPLDLETRKSIPLPDELFASMEQMVVKGMAI